MGNTGQYHGTYDWLFSYDLAYNPQSFRATSTLPATYGFNTDNQTTSLLSGSLTAPIYDGDGGPSTYSSPSNGLTGGYNGGAFSFDGENRLAAATGPSFPFSAYYDGGGMRTQFTVSNATTYYLYDDEAGGGVPVVELAYASGNATTSLQYLNGTCADGWRLRYVGGVAYVETYDPQGSIVQSGQDLAAGQTQYARATYCYDGFGGLRGRWSSAGSTTNVHQDPAGFGGQYGYYQDLQTGLEHLGARYYDGGTGRFVTRDPIGYNGGENLYAFCGNNPVNEEDPEGTDPAKKNDDGDDDTAVNLGSQTKASSELQGSFEKAFPQLARLMERGIHFGPIRRMKKRYEKSVNYVPKVVKPLYENPGHHDPESPNFRGGGPDRTSILPKDAEQVYNRTAIVDPDSFERNDSTKTPRTWYGINSSGVIYRYAMDNNMQGKVHWNGDEVQAQGLRNVPNDIQKALRGK